MDQIIGQTNCHAGGTIISSLDGLSPRIDVSSCPSPYLLRGAASSLLAMSLDASTAALAPMRITKALTPFLNQYSDFRRSFLRICGVTAKVGYVGTTVHELGESVVLSNADEWSAYFDPSKWRRVGNTFTYIGPDVLNAGRRTIETFQLMWSTAFPSDRIAVNGVFDSDTQIRAEQALAGGIVFPGLCGVVADSGWNQTALMLTILVPVVFLCFYFLGLMLYHSRMDASRTPFDSRVAGEDSRTTFSQLQLPDGDLHNSVENTTDLSEYAKSTEPEDDATTDGATSGIWDDE